MTFIAHEKQAAFINAVFSGEYNYLAFGGSVRGGKTFGGIATLAILCKVFPGSRWAIVRTDLPTLRRNTLPAYYKFRDQHAPDFLGEFNQGTWIAKCANGSEILLFSEGLEGDPDLDRWKGLEVNGFLLEEANELAEKSFYKAMERAGAWIIPKTKHSPSPNQPPPLILLTFNPAMNWVYKLFYKPWRSGTIAAPYFFQPSSLADNPGIPEAYKASVANLPEAEYRRFIQGEWEVENDPNQLIHLEWVWNAKNVDPVFGRNSIGVDVARYGKDKTCLCLASGNAVVKIEQFDQMSTTRTAKITSVWANDPVWPVMQDNLIVDAVGLGAGTADRLVEMGYRDLREFIAGAKPVPRKKSFFQFANRRSQAWWEFREMLRLGQVSLPDDFPEDAISDLVAPRYEITQDRVVKVETKDDIKERLGRSTDYGDSIVTAFFKFPAKRKPAILSGTISQENPWQ
jgi:hypothetical protein